MGAKRGLFLEGKSIGWGDVWA